MLSYFGLVDDFAVRHNDGAITTMAGLNRNLIFAVIFDESLLINDGHIISSEVVRKAVLKPKLSPLRKLVDSGYIKILTRNERRLDILTETMADSGIEPARRLLLDAHYPTVKRTLSDWCESLSFAEPTHSFRDWPAWNTSEIFEKLAITAVDQAAARVPDKNQTVQLIRFRDHYARRKFPSRTTWEGEVEQLRQADQLSSGVCKTLLHIANESYQYSWGCALSTGKDAVKVFTRSPQFLDLDVSQEPIDSAKRKAVTVYGPNLDIATKQVGSNWAKLAEISQPGSRLFEAKHIFQKTLNEYYASPAISDKDMKDYADNYSNELAMHFGGEKTAFTFDVGLTLIGTGVGMATAGPGGALVGALPGLAFGLVGNLASHMGGPKFIQRLMLPFKKKLIQPQSGKTPTSCFQVDPEKAAKYLQGVSQFKK